MEHIGRNYAPKVNRGLADYWVAGRPLPSRPLDSLSAPKLEFGTRQKSSSRCPPATDSFVEELNPIHL